MISSKNSVIVKALLIAGLFFLTACQQMGSTEYGVRFWKLPRFLGGGVSSKVFKPGEVVIHYPVISEIYTIDTAVKDITWGDVSKAQDPEKAHYVLTRALDGNEVALAVTVSYKVSSDPAVIRNLINNVARSNEGIRKIVEAAARADIRTYMNKLKTAEFIKRESRYKAVDEVKKHLSKRLAPYGIEIERVNLDDFKFWRVTYKGGRQIIDTTYEDMLKEIQKKREETNRERARIQTVIKQKQKELQEAIARKNELIEEAKGYKNQAEERGRAYLEAKENEAKAILAQGKAEAEGLKKKIQALASKGGIELVKLKLVKELLQRLPQFVVIERGGKGANGKVRVERLDINDLLNQLGLIEGIKEKSIAAKSKAKLKEKVATSK